MKARPDTEPPCGAGGGHAPPSPTSPRIQIAPSVARVIEIGGGTHVPVSTDRAQDSCPAGVNFTRAPPTSASPEAIRELCTAVPALGSRSTSPAYHAAT